MADPNKNHRGGDIELSAASPIAARGDARFSGYFHALCAELDIQTEKTA